LTCGSKKHIEEALAKIKIAPTTKRNSNDDDDDDDWGGGGKKVEEEPLA
jgi:hypothetical protein